MLRLERRDGEEATRPLGSPTIALKHATGLLIGDDGADGINVTAVDRVIQKYP
jgi:hypothetical protein